MEQLDALGSTNAETSTTSPCVLTKAADEHPSSGLEPQEACEDALEPLAYYQDWYRHQRLNCWQKQAQLDSIRRRQLRGELAEGGLSQERLLQRLGAELEEAAIDPWERLAQSEEAHTAATVIQRFWRAHLARVRVAELKAEAARKLQELQQQQAKAKRQLAQQAKDLLLALYAQRQYCLTRDRMLQAKVRAHGRRGFSAHG
jgi:hypothetical protein